MMFLRKIRYIPKEEDIQFEKSVMEISFDHLEKANEHYPIIRCNNSEYFTLDIYRCKKRRLFATLAILQVMKPRFYIKRYDETWQNCIHILDVNKD